MFRMALPMVAFGVLISELSFDIPDCANKTPEAALKSAGIEAMADKASRAGIAPRKRVYF